MNRDAGLPLFGSLTFPRALPSRVDTLEGGASRETRRRTCGATFTILIVAAGKIQGVG